ncbi:MAG: cytochrome D1 domain-containing protein [Geminicoccaceae bacterium]|nr:protein nirF [Geminicoccaceae bacterium]MDW8125503.1 cytochrome D1 domain-containing protein [Geminicoccaceae bacterium]
MRRRGLLATSAALATFPRPAGAGCPEPRGTGDLLVVVERARGSVLVAESTRRTILGRIEGLGDLSHASMVFSRDARYAFVFGRDGGLSKVDLVERRLRARIVQAGNAIGGAIGRDGRIVAVANYEPGGVRLFDAESLDPLLEIPAIGADGRRSKVVGLVDTADGGFAFALFDAGEIWLLDVTDLAEPRITRFAGVGSLPYDGNVTADGRFYLAGLFGEDGVVLVDLWHPEAGARRILDGYGRGEAPLPVYKMPHLEGWGTAGEHLFLPAVGRHEVLAVDRRSWREAARIPVLGQPVFVVVRPDGREAWVSFAHPDNGKIQILDLERFAVAATLSPGRAILHLEFTPRGDQVWLSARDDDRVIVMDPRRREVLAHLPAEKPSGIFSTARAHRIGS